MGIFTKVFYILLFFLYVAKSASSICSDELEQSFDDNKIVPDEIDKAPCKLMRVKYGNRSVELGNQFIPEEVFVQPDLVKWKACNDSMYMLVMLDPDVPSRANPTYREVLHWFIGNIRGSNVSSGEEYAGYVPSLPGNGTGLHRYTYLVYKQPDFIDYNFTKINSTTIAPRLKFSITNFAEQYDLGQPYAGNFYNCEWDPFVDTQTGNYPL